MSTVLKALKIDPDKPGVEQHRNSRQIVTHDKSFHVVYLLKDPLDGFRIRSSSIQLTEAVFVTRAQIGPLTVTKQSASHVSYCLGQVGNSAN